MSWLDEPATNLRFIKPTHRAQVGLPRLLLYRDVALDGRVRVVVRDHDVFVCVVEDRIWLTVEADRRQWSHFARQLLVNLLQVVEVDVRVATYPDELADLQVALLCNHVSQQRVASDVEGHAQEHVSTALVQLARQLAVRDVELEQCVARLQRHLAQVGRIPCADNESARIRSRLDGVDYVLDLVDRLAVRCGPRDPLNTVDRTDTTVHAGELFVRDDLGLEAGDQRLPLWGVRCRNGLTGCNPVLLERPVGPDVVVLLHEFAKVVVTPEEPEQLADDEAHRNALRCDQREPLGEVVADRHLLVEEADSSGAGTVTFLLALLSNNLKDLLVRRSLLVSHNAPMITDVLEMYAHLRHIVQDIVKNPYKPYTTYGILWLSTLRLHTKNALIYKRKKFRSRTWITRQHRQLPLHMRGRLSSRDRLKIGLLTLPTWHDL